MLERLKKIIIGILIVVQIMMLFSCAPYKQEEILCEYKDLNCLYYTKDEYKKYKYSDFVVDDITNGAYKKATPNIADYKTGNGPFDIDIPAFVNAKMDYAIKNEMMKQHEHEIDEFCMKVRDDYFEQRNSYVYFYDKSTNKSTMLYDGPVTNISYDDETPMITFDVGEIKDKDLVESLKGRKIYLSDIIASNTTLDGYMKVILGSGHTKMKFFMDKRIDNDPRYNSATYSDVLDKA